MRRLYLRDFQPGDVIEDVFVITNKQLSATTTGKHFIKAFLSDRTGQVTARMWNANRDLFNSIPESGFVRVRGRIENYQNNLQFIIEQTAPPRDGSFDISDLMPHTKRDIDTMCQRLFELCESIQNRHLNALVHAYLDDEDLMNNFAKAPAATTFHHAFIGGLLEHTLNAMEVADAMCRFYPGLNRDIVVAGIFMHDIAKTWELSYDCAFAYSDGGQLVGHVVKAAMWIEHKAKIAEGTLGEKIPQRLIDVMQHIALSHHGLPEFGAAKVPATPEAIVVHTIENLDAKLMMALGVTRGDQMPGGEGNWTEYMKAFGGRLYRPDVAPADAPIFVEEGADEQGADGQRAEAQGAGTQGAETQGTETQGAGAQGIESPRAGETSADKSAAEHGKFNGNQPIPGTFAKPPAPGPSRMPAKNFPRPSQTPPQPRPVVATTVAHGQPAVQPHLQPHANPVTNLQHAQNNDGVQSRPSGPPVKVAINNPLFETTPSRKK